MNAKVKEVISNGISAGLVATAAYGIYWFDNAALYHTFAPEYSNEHKIEVEGTQMSNEDLEQKLKVKLKGEYSQSTAIQLLKVFEEISKKNPALAKHLNKVIVVPTSYETHYDGLADPITDKIVLKDNVKDETIFHELGHNYSFSMPDSFWRRWESVSKGNYQFNKFPFLAPLAVRLDMLHKPSNEFISANGILTAYGSTSIDEDVAEFVGDIYTGNKKLSHVPEKEKDKFMQKLKLLQEYGFISDDMYQDSVAQLSFNAVESLERRLRACMEELKEPQIVRLMENGITVFKSENGCEVSYYFGMHGSAITIVPDKKAAEDIFDGPHIYINPYDSKMKLSGQNEISLPVFSELTKKLEKLGYLDYKTYSITKYIINNNESKEEVAKSNKIPISYLHGPIPYKSWINSKELLSSAYYAHNDDLIKNIKNKDKEYKLK